MTRQEVLELLESNTNERGIAHWERLKPKGSKLTSFGIGLTVLRKLARQVGRDHKLAQQLWKSNVYDARIIGLLIDDPKQLTPEQAEAQVEELEAGMLEHVFVSCDATLPKTPFSVDLAKAWMDSKDETRRRCGFGLLYELAKKKHPGLDDTFFLDCIRRIEKDVDGEANWVRASMSAALLGIGKRNAVLNRATVEAVRRIGIIDVDYGDDNDCQPIDVLKHLTSAHTKKKLGL